MSQTADLLSSTLHRGIQSTVPLLLPACGELITERAGLVNIGIEGVMLIGALAGAAAAWATGSVATGFLAAAGAGALTGLVFSIWAVRGARDQIVTGLAINLLALGITGAALERINRAAAADGGTFTTPRLQPLVDIDRVAHPWLHAAFGHDSVTLGAGLIVLLMGMGLARTRSGLSLRAVGENPDAADAAGIPVGWIRTLAATLGCGLCGIGGAYLPLSLSDRFQEGMTDGRGFVALALVIFGGWSPFRLVAAALFFGMLDALQVTLQPRLGRHVHVLYAGLVALPYAVTLAALAGFVRRSHAPAALAVPYRRG